METVEVKYPLKSRQLYPERVFLCQFYAKRPFKFATNCLNNVSKYYRIGRGWHLLVEVTLMCKSIVQVPFGKFNCVLTFVCKYCGLFGKEVSIVKSWVRLGWFCKD